MAWAIGYDENWKRDVGYGVPAECDHPECSARIDRGLAYVCGADVFGGGRGCGLFFCEKHRGSHGLCERCGVRRGRPFSPKPDLPEWTRHKLTHPSWEEWRRENPDEVEALRKAVA